MLGEPPMGTTENATRTWRTAAETTPGTLVRLQAKDFRSLRAVDVTVPAFAILVGANANRRPRGQGTGTVRVVARPRPRSPSGHRNDREPRVTRGPEPLPPHPLPVGPRGAVMDRFRRHPPLSRAVTARLRTDHRRPHDRGAGERHPPPCHRPSLSVAVFSLQRPDPPRDPLARPVGRGRAGAIAVLRQDGRRGDRHRSRRPASAPARVAQRTGSRNAARDRVPRRSIERSRNR